MQSTLSQILHNHQIAKIVGDNYPANGSSARIFHGRGKKWESLEHFSFDLYDQTILVITYKEISNEDKIDLVNFFSSLDLFKSKNILLQKRFEKNQEIEILKGELLTDQYALENEMKFIINLAKPQNIGFFLDMKIGREWVKNNANNRRVLNLFSYTCSLSVAALKGGAQSVVNVDMSDAALSVGRSNHKLNGIAADKAKYLSHDIMKSLGNLTNKGPYDLVIIDPPSNQGNSFKVERDYIKILRRLDLMTNKDALVMACLNAPHLTSEFLISNFKEVLPNFELIERFYSSYSPMESNLEESLKILIYKKLS